MTAGEGTMVKPSLRAASPDQGLLRLAEEGAGLRQKVGSADEKKDVGWLHYRFGLGICNGGLPPADGHDRHPVLLPQTALGETFSGQGRVFAETYGNDVSIGEVSLEIHQWRRFAGEIPEHPVPVGADLGDKSFNLILGNEVP